MFFYQLAFAQRVSLTSHEKDKAKRLINKYNGVTGVYRTIYNFRNKVENYNAVIDKVYFDFDVTEDNLELIETRKLHEFLKEKGIRHSLYFSGRGFHLYIYTEKIFAGDLLNPRVALQNVFDDLKKKLDLHPDKKTRGDLMRISRLPNTMNIKSKLYCIELSPEELYLEKKEIEKLAESPRSIKIERTGKLIDLKKFDGDLWYKPPKIEFDSKLEDEINSEFLFKNIPKCVTNLLLKGNPNHRERFIIITALRDLCYSKEQVENILEKFLTEKKFYHCLFEEDQLEYLFERQDLLFPHCRTISEEGNCVQGCRGQKIYVEVCV